MKGAAADAHLAVVYRAAGSAVMDTPTADLHSGELRLLVVEDSESDAKLAVWGLKEAGFSCVYRTVETEEAMRTALSAEIPDLILSDFSLPKFDGMSALAVAMAEAPDVPFIFLTGMVGEELAIEALKCGAIDYVLKSNPMRLAPAVMRAAQEEPARRPARDTPYRCAADAVRNQHRLGAYS